eukprot:12874632-Alexandrium_andersonii.AAC.1
MADHTEHPPGLEQAAPLPKRSRSARASPSTSSPPIASAPTTAPTVYVPSGAVGGIDARPTRRLRSRLRSTPRRIE